MNKRVHSLKTRLQVASVLSVIISDTGQNVIPLRRKGKCPFNMSGRNNYWLDGVGRLVGDLKFQIIRLPAQPRY